MAAGVATGAQQHTHFKAYLTLLPLAKALQHTSRGALSLALIKISSSASSLLGSLIAEPSKSKREHLTQKWLTI